MLHLNGGPPPPTAAMATAGDGSEPGAAAQKIGIRATFDITQGVLLVTFSLIAFCFVSQLGKVWVYSATPIVVHVFG